MRNGSLDLYFRGFYRFLGKYRGVNGTLYKARAGAPHTAMATMGGRPHRQPFSIFATDYKNYEIYYSCSNIADGFMKYEMFSISTRKMKIDKLTLAKVKAIVKSRLPSYDLDKTSGLVWTKQGGDCKYVWNNWRK